MVNRPSWCGANESRYERSCRCVARQLAATHHRDEFSGERVQRAAGQDHGGLGNC